MEILTVGDLRNALEPYTDDTPVYVEAWDPQIITYLYMENGVLVIK